jgi:hypothetical protein
LTKDGEEYYSYHRGGRGETNVDREKNQDERKPASVIWSHDSKKFALIRTDERAVEDLWVINSVAEPRPTLETYKYHMPGENEAPQTESVSKSFSTRGDRTWRQAQFGFIVITVGNRGGHPSRSNLIGDYSQDVDILQLNLEEEKSGKK